jgi:IS30 family transposase
LLKTKQAAEVLKALKDIISKNHLEEKISSIGSDEGTEFTANKEQLKKLGVNLYYCKGEHKAFQVNQ